MQGSTGKSLSNGTLSLRFMQNALRSKQQGAVELERAKVKDDAEWEVSMEVREAWGLTSDPGRQTDRSVTCESSYLPFMFSSEQDADQSDSDEDLHTSLSSAGVPKTNGRRSFNDGREIIPDQTTTDNEEKPVQVPIPPKRDREARKERAPASGKGSHVGRPGWLTTARGGSNYRNDLISQQNSKSKEMPSYTKFQNMASGTPVVQMISEQTAQTVGVDLHTSRQLKDYGDLGGNSTKTNGSLTFLRPAGVDSPVAGGSNSSKRGRSDSVSGELSHATTASDAQTPGDHGERKQEKRKKKKQKKSTVSDNQVQ